MSEFDKEAEREKLRKKFAKEDRNRESTEHMSELLLRGATMLNAHCDNCGSPLFRYDGQEFCPTCQLTVEELSDGQAAENAAADAAQATDATNAMNAEGSTDSADAADGRTASPTDESETESPDPGPVEVPVEPTSGDGERPADRQTRDDRQAPANQQAARSTSETTATDLEARAALDAAISRLARRATETDDPRRAREFLEAAREAAETLATLDGTR